MNIIPFPMINSCTNLLNQLAIIKEKSQCFSSVLNNTVKLYFCYFSVAQFYASNSSGTLATTTYKWANSSHSGCPHISCNTYWFEFQSFGFLLLWNLKRFWTKMPSCFFWTEQKTQKERISWLQVPWVLRKAILNTLRWERKILVGKSI